MHVGEPKKAKADLVDEFLRTSQAAEQNRRKRAWILGIAIFSVVTLLALVAFYFAFRFRNSANEAAANAQEAIARQLVAQAQLTWEEPSPTQSLLLAIESLKRKPSFEGDQVLRQGLSLIPPTITEFTHSETVTDIHFSPDGRWLATATRGGTVIVWDTATGKEIRQLTQIDGVNLVAFSDDGKWLATGSGGGYYTISEGGIWNALSGEKFTSLETKDQNYIEINSLVFGPYGNRLAGAIGHTAYVWDRVTGQTIAQFIHENKINGVSFDLQGNKLISGSEDSTARVWDINTGRELMRMENQIGIRQMALSHDRRLLAASGWDGLVRVWDLETGSQISSLVHNDEVQSMTFSPDSGLLATSGWDNAVRLWDPRTGQSVSVIPHQRRVEHVEFSPDGTWLATAGVSGVVRVWTLATGQEAARIPYESEFTDFVFSSDSNRLAVVNNNIVQIRTLIPNQTTARRIFNGPVNAVEFSLNSKWLAAGGDETSDLVVWNIDTGQEIFYLNKSGNTSVLAFSPDHKWFLIDYEKELKIFSVNNGKKIDDIEHPLPRTTGRLIRSSEAIALSSDGRRLAVLGSDNVIRIWQIQSWAKLGEVETDSRLWAVGFDAYNGFLLTISDDRSIEFWKNDQLNWSPARKSVQVNHYSDMQAVAFSPDGKWLATGNEFGTAWIWEVTSGREVTQVTHDELIWAVAVSYDGTFLATGSSDRTARVWEISTGREVARISHESGVRAVSFSPDGKWLATGSDNGQVQVWLLRSEDLVNEVCTRLTRNLTTAEWEAAFKDEPYNVTCSNLPLHPSLIEKGNNLAFNGNIEDAIIQFQRAIELDPDSVVFEPESEVIRLAAQGLESQGQELAWAGDLEGTISKLQEALKIDPSLNFDPEVKARKLVASALISKGERIARMGQIDKALEVFREAQDLDPQLEIEAQSWHTLCWHGVLQDKADKVIDACEIAVSLNAKDGNFRDSRGVARLLIGDLDGAVKDFNAFIEWIEDQDDSTRYWRIVEIRQQWIKQINKGSSPATSEIFEQLPVGLKVS